MQLEINCCCGKTIECIQLNAGNKQALDQIIFKILSFRLIEFPCLGFPFLGYDQ